MPEDSRAAVTPSSAPAWICDIVYRWVNPASLREQQQTNIGNAQRWRDNDELRLSMRSWAHVEGLRTFHVMAKGHPPGWLDPTNPRVRWWNETRLLDTLRVARGIDAPLQARLP